MRRTRIDSDPNLPVLFAGWRHHAFVTNRTGDVVTLDRDHRAHAVVELAIRDLKHGTGLNHCPSGSFNANAASLMATTLAHNLIRWTQLLGEPPASRLVNAKTFRRRLLTIPGRITRTARRWTLHLPGTLALAARVRGHPRTTPRTSRAHVTAPTPAPLEAGASA